MVDRRFDGLNLRLQQFLHVKYVGRSRYAEKSLRNHVLHVIV